MKFGQHPVNLALRFLLEIVTLLIAGYWAYCTETSNLKYLFAIGLPLLLASIWGTFAVPNDPSRSGKTIVKTPGIIRLTIEFLFFGCGVWFLQHLELKELAIAFSIITVVHYLCSMDRITWLVKQKGLNKR